ncbi:MAG TPA: hypothetical protein VKQ11_07635 [Candidatus Sulfotelmatobacter sp.]|nr:hypothetical protein [Candidatus Sulfotelmatobacter sp.]
MLSKLAAVLFMVTLVFSLSAPGFAKDKTKQDRVEGRIVRSDKDKSNLTVHSVRTNTDVTVSYDANTKWVSQHHGDKTAMTIDSSEVKDGDYVICRGSYGDKGMFNATSISKRLSHSSQ